MYKPHQTRGSGTSRNDEYSTHEAEDNRKTQLKAEVSLYPTEFCRRTSYNDRTFDDRMNRLAAYKKVKHGDCHFPQDYKDDTELATWVNSEQCATTTH